MKTKLFVTSLCVAAAALTAGSTFAATPLYFLNHNDLPESGAVASWDGASKMTSWNGGAPEQGPTVEVINGQKWSKNYATPNILDPWNGTPGSVWSQGSGYRLAYNQLQAGLTGTSFVVAVKADRNGYSTSWTSIVDIMYDKLTLGIQNDTGKIIVKRNTGQDVSVGTIESGKATILSLVCQADGSYQVWADGVSMLTGGAQGTMTEWDPNRTAYFDQPDWAGTGVAVNNWDAWWAAVMAAEPTVTAAWDWTDLNALPNKDTYWGFTSPVEDFKKYVTVGRGFDGWSAFNGDIGDVKIFGSALSNEERLAEEASMTTAMGMGAVPEPASIVAMLSGLIGLAGFGIRRKK